MTSPLGTVVKHPDEINTSPNQVTTYKYPANLANDPALPHYIGFYINVPDGTTTTLANENALGYIPSDGNTNVSSANAHTSTINAVVGVAGVAVGASASLSTINKITSLGIRGSGFLKAVAVVAGAVTAGVIAYELSDSAFQNNQYQRISSCVMLGLHSMPTLSSSSQWGDTELGTAGGILAGGSSADVSGSIPKGDIATMMARNAIKLPGASKAFGGIIGQLGAVSGGLNVGGTTSAITKEVTNPFREQLFEKVYFREFSYSYNFMPRSKEEAETVRNIIKTFRFHMHPDLSTSGIFFKFPSQFEIVHYFNGKENTNMSKLTTAVLLSVDVQYGDPNIKFATFDDGMPIETSMTLRFRETEVLTKARIKAGY